MDGDRRDRGGPRRRMVDGDWRRRGARLHSGLTLTTRVVAVAAWTRDRGDRGGPRRMERAADWRWRWARDPLALDVVASTSWGVREIGVV